MPTTANKGYSVQAAGSNPGTWGAGSSDALNEGVIELLDKDLGGIKTSALSSSPVTLSAADARNLVQKFTGILLANVVVTSPNVGFNIYENATTGNFTVTVQFTGGVGGTVTVPQGAAILLVADTINGVRRAGAPALAAGTTMLFVQSSAPPGWTKLTTHNDKALRVVSGTAASGGSTAFSTVFASRVFTGTVGDTTLTVNQIPLHGHPIRLTSVGDDGNGSGGLLMRNTGTRDNFTFTGTPTDTFGEQLGGAGGGQSHTHDLGGTAQDFAVQYVDVIIATLG
jgi:hypothetical protein